MKSGSWVYVDDRLGIFLRVGRPEGDDVDESVAEVHFVNRQRETVAEEWVPVESVRYAAINDEKALKPALAKVGAK